MPRKENKKVHKETCAWERWWETEDSERVPLRSGGVLTKVPVCPCGLWAQLERAALERDKR